jgi:small subunit ribosomal protein S20
MPLTKSAEKRARQSLVRRDRLRPYKTRVNTVKRKIADVVKAGKKDEAAKMLPEAFKAIDTAAKKKVLPRNAADRMKSGLARAVSTR